MDEIFATSHNELVDPTRRWLWHTYQERYDGTPFTERGFDNILSLIDLVPWLAELRAA
ncbi:MAG: hypothetical protein HYX53_11565 [Chloroflexi bacterium]|nr:hypothetical protein [Chloroflexota bacterium]